MVCAFFSGIRATASQFEPLRGYRREEREFFSFFCCISENGAYHLQNLLSYKVAATKFLDILLEFWCAHDLY